MKVDYLSSADDVFVAVQKVKDIFRDINNKTQELDWDVEFPMAYLNSAMDNFMGKIRQEAEDKDQQARQEEEIVNK